VVRGDHEQGRRGLERRRRQDLIAAGRPGGYRSPSASLANARTRAAGRGHRLGRRVEDPALKLSWTDERRPGPHRLSISRVGRPIRHHDRRRPDMPVLSVLRDVSFRPSRSRPCLCVPVAAGRETVVLMERLRKRRHRLVANARGDPGDGVVARCEHEGGLVHPTRDQVAVHRLADEPREASREGGPAEPSVAPR
jgi:hypothetical protein